MPSAARIVDWRIEPQKTRGKTAYRAARVFIADFLLSSKVQQEQARLAELTEQNRQQEQQAAALGKQIERIQNQHVDVAVIEKIEAKSIPFSTKVAVEREDFDRISTLAKKYVAAEKKKSKLQKALDAANRLTAKLKAEINSLQ